MRPNQYLGVECPFCGAEFHRDRTANGRPCIVHPTSMETNRMCLIGGQIWISSTGDLGGLLLRIVARSEKITSWREAWNQRELERKPRAVAVNSEDLPLRGV